MSLLELESVCYRYPGGGPEVLAGVDLRIEAGELVAIAGPNGSGKSTLMKILARVLMPHGGEVKLEGRSTRTWPGREYAKKVGYLPQDSTPAGYLRAIDVVLSGRAPKLGRFQWESEEDVAIARAALLECDAASLEERLIDEMSGGERKRIELARVLAGEPELLLLDEPLAALDVSHVQHLARLLRRVAGQAGRTVVFVAHDLNWSSALASRMVVVRNGRILADGAPSAILDEELIAEAFGLRARVVEAGGRRWIVPAE